MNARCILQPALVVSALDDQPMGLMEDTMRVPTVKQLRAKIARKCWGLRAVAGASRGSFSPASLSRWLQRTDLSEMKRYAVASAIAQLEESDGKPNRDAA